MGHEDDGFGAMIGGILDGGEGADDTLVVGDVLIGVQGDVEVDLETEVSLSLCTLYQRSKAEDAMGSGML